jgi:hypothetical protein
MSLLHLVHRNIVIKFSETTHFKPEALYAFRLTGVDGMGFLQIQDLNSAHDVTSEPYWVNKDLVREIHEIDLAKTKLPILFLGKVVEAAPVETASEPTEPETTPKPAKKAAPKAKSVLKNKPVLN